MSDKELKDMVDLLEAHNLGGHTEDFEDRTVIVIHDREPSGAFGTGANNPFLELLKFCEETETDPNRFLEDLDFARYDQVD